MKKNIDRIKNIKFNKVIGKIKNIKFNKIVDIIKKNKKIIIMVLIGIILVILMIVGINSYKEYRERYLANPDNIPIRKEIYGHWKYNGEENISLILNEDGTGRYDGIGNEKYDFTFTGNGTEIRIHYKKLKKNETCYYRIDNDNAMYFGCGDVIIVDDFIKE